MADGVTGVSGTPAEYARKGQRGRRGGLSGRGMAATLSVGLKAFGILGRIETAPMESLSTV